VVFWALTSYRLIDGYQCFRGTCCLHLQDKSDLGMYVVDYTVKLQCMSVGRRGARRYTMIWVNWNGAEEM